MAQGIPERHVVRCQGIAEAEAECGMLEAELLRRSPTLFEFGKRSLRQVIENAATAIVDRDDDGIAALREGEAAEVMLAGQVTDHRDDSAMDRGNAEGRRYVAVDAAGAAVPKKEEELVAATGMTVHLAYGQRVADKDRGAGGQFVDQDSDVSGRFQARFGFKGGETGMPARRGGRWRRVQQRLAEGQRICPDDMGEPVLRVGPARPEFDERMKRGRAIQQCLQLAGDGKRSEA